MSRRGPRGRQRASRVAVTVLLAISLARPVVHLVNDLARRWYEAEEFRILEPGPLPNLASTLVAIVSLTFLFTILQLHLPLVAKAGTVIGSSLLTIAVSASVIRTTSLTRNETVILLLSVWCACATVLLVVCIATAGRFRVEALRHR